VAKILNIGERLTYWRKKLSFNQSELAKQSGISQSAISYIEVGENQPTVQTIETLCNTMGISLLEFFANDSKPLETPAHIKKLIKAAETLTPEQAKLITQLIKNLKG